MTKNLTNYNFNNLDIRSHIDENNEPWFVGKDVCKILELKDHNKTLGDLDADERGWVLVNTLGGPQNMVAVNESGLYTLIIKSRTVVNKKQCIEHMASSPLETKFDILFNNIKVKETGYIYVYDFGDMIKFGISVNNPDKRRGSHISTRGSMFLSSEVINEFVIKHANYKEIENKLKSSIGVKYGSVYSQEWVKGISFEEVVNLIKEEI